MSEQKPTIVATSCESTSSGGTSSASGGTSSASASVKYAWCVSDIQDNDDLPSKPPPLTRMSTGAIINGVFMTKDEMMNKMDADKEKKDI